jgi:DNA replication and repair protein RecF
MKLLHLRSEYFRNISTLTINCSPGINVICGDNGSGKSAFLEMIYCLSRGRSFRSHLASPLIQYSKNYCTVFGEIISDDYSTSIGFRKNRQGKTELKVGHDDSLPTIKTLAQLLPVQLFHPESHDFLNGGPSVRRAFIDWGLFYTEPRFILVWRRFHHVLKQRNIALAHKQSAQYIYAWDIELVTLGEALSQFRQGYVSQLIQEAQPWMTLLLDTVKVELQYEAGWPTQQSLASFLKTNIEKDIKYGYTTAGPHRFDIVVRSRALSAALILSRGEQKRLICALYLAQGKLFKQLTQKSCVYLLDDILSELDATYQSKVLDALMTLDAQLFITSLDSYRVQSLLSCSGCELFHIVEGKLNPVPSGTL